MKKLVDYVRSHGGDVRLAKSLVEAFKNGNPPSVYSPEKVGEYYHNCYRSKANQRLLAQAMQVIFERERLFSGRSSTMHLIPRGLSEAEAKQAILKSYLQKQALKYAYYGVGNCSHRSAYASIILAKAFASRDVKTTLCSFPARDHYVVFVTDLKTKQSLVYDPLTNPELLFDWDTYKTKILQVCFDRLPKPQRAPQYQLDVSADQYDALQAKMKAHHEEVVDFGSVADLLADYDYVRSLGAVDDAETITKAALQKLEQCRKQAPTPVPAIPSEAVELDEAKVGALSADASPSSTSLLGVADACLFAVKNGLAIEKFLTDAQKEAAREYGMELSR